MSASVRAEPEDCRAIPDPARAALDVARMFREHGAMVERALRRSGVAEVDLADARQEVFIVVHRRLAEFEARSSVTTWLYGIAYRVALDFRRRAARRHARSSTLSDETAAVGDSARAIEQRDALVRALLAIDRLAPERRDVFVLHELCELPMREVAARLRCPLKTAFSRLYAARRALLGELRDAGILAALPPWCWLRPTPPSMAHVLRMHVPAQLSASKVVLALGAACAFCLWAPSRQAVPLRAPQSLNAAVRFAPPRAPAQLTRTTDSEPATSAVAPRVAAAHRARRTQVRSAPELDTHAPNPALAAANELEVIRASAVDLRPVGWNPFAAEFDAPAAPLRVRVDGPVRAVASVERAFAMQREAEADDFDL
jgi:RNA polymerase sigma-70 factor (ECF subfamily)